LALGEAGLFTDDIFDANDGCFPREGYFLVWFVADFLYAVIF
jgi:hypothetical protein